MATVRVKAKLTPLPIPRADRDGEYAVPAGKPDRWYEYGIYCPTCENCLGTVERPDFTGPANRVGSGKHIHLRPTFEEKPGPLPYYKAGTSPARAHSARHAAPDAPVGDLYLWRTIPAVATFVPHKAIVVRCDRCDANVEVERP